MLDKNLLFHQDNASFHKRRKLLESIEVIFGKNKIWLPTDSPDLSPIETVWNVFKQELTKRKNTTQAAGRLHYAEAIPSGLFQIIVSANVNAGCDGQADTYVKYVRCNTTTLDVYYQNPASAAGSTYFAYITGWWKTRAKSLLIMW